MNENKESSKKNLAKAYKAANVDKNHQSTSANDGKLFILYVNNLGLKNEIKIDYERVLSFYEKIFTEVNLFKIADHFGNILVLKYEKDDDNKLIKIIDTIAKIDHDFRIGLHVVNKDDILDIKELNRRLNKKDIPTSFYDTNSKNNKNTNFFDDNEIFGTGLFYTQKIANITSTPNFVISNDILIELIKSTDIIKSEITNEETEIEKILEKLNSKSFKHAFINTPVPFVDTLNNKDYVRFIYYVTKQEKKNTQGDSKTQGEEKINSVNSSNNFFNTWRVEKRTCEELYIGYAPFDGGNDTHIKKRRIIIHNICNIQGEKYKNNEGINIQYPSLDRYYFDSLFSVFGYSTINFNEKVNKYITNLNETDKNKNLKDYLKGYTDIDKRKVISKDITRKIISDNMNKWSLTNRFPVFIALSSFPEQKDEIYFRKNVNDNTNQKIYFRTEDIFGKVVINKSFSEYYNNNEDNRFLIWNNENKLEEIKNAKTTIDRNVKKEITNEISINHEDYSNNSFDKIKTEEMFEKNIFLDNDWYLLIIFNLDSYLLSNEQKIEVIFKNIEHKSQGISACSDEILETIAYGILRGTWDGFILCHINTNKKSQDSESVFCYANIIKNLLVQAGYGHSFFADVISNCEIFFLKTLVKDDWTENLAIASSEVCNFASFK